MFSGKNCERRNYCSPDPCQNNAPCRSLDVTFQCDCLPGFQGPTCGINRGKYPVQL